MALPRTYPAELKNADWQKKKGLVAKIATGSDGSGIGKLLVALEAAHAKINWTNFETNNAVKGVAPQSLDDEHLKKYVQGAQDEIKAALPARKLASAVEDEAKKVAAEWAKHKLIPKSAAAAALAVSNAAKGLAYAMAPATLADEIKKEAGPLESKINKMKEHRKKSIEETKRFCDKVIAEGPKVKTPADWTKNKFHSDHVRNVGINLALAVKVRPDLAGVHAKYKPIAANTNNPDEKTLKARVDEAVNGAKQIRSALG